LECPTPNAEDKFREAAYFFHQMHETYHRPHLFKYNLHAFLGALSSITEFLAKDMEKIGLVKEWKSYFSSLARDPLLDSLARGRNTATHQKQLVIESRVTIGIFRYRKMKLAFINDLVSDEPTQAMLARYVPVFLTTFMDEEHSAIGEQIGVQRLYFEKKAIKYDEDLLTAIRRSMSRVTVYLAKAHDLVGLDFDSENEDALYPPGWSDEITVLLETDVDPSLAKKWEWE